MNKLWLRLTLSFIGVSLLVIGVVAWVVRGSVTRNFGAYVSASNMARFGGDLVTDLETYYVTNNSWDGVNDLLPTRGSGQGNGAGRNGDLRGAQVFVTNPDRVIVAATYPDWVGQPADTLDSTRAVELQANGQLIGYLGEQTPGTLALQQAEDQFLQETTNGLLITGFSVGLVAFLLGISLSYSLTRPLHHLTEQITSWRLRDESAPLEVHGTEEIQRLGGAFNDLLNRLTEGEAQRQRMSADIAHELRTPVTVMRGHLEAMMDGVYPMDAAHLAVAYNHVLHLARLVEDLRLLTQAEARRLPLNPSDVDVVHLVTTAVENFRPLTQDRQIDISMQTPTTSITTHADVHRLRQILDNLLSNAVRHTPDGGAIHVEITEHPQHVAVAIANQSATPLTDEQVKHLFDRFWRGEDARERDRGGSGLGLAITRELLRLHGGDIHAERNEDKVQMTFTLPTK